MNNLSVISYEEALKKSEGSNRYLLLGNGFSMALFPEIFSYQRLFEEADFGKDEHIKELFTELDTYDFEFIIRNLLTAPSLIEVYSNCLDKKYNTLVKTMKNDSAKLKDILVQTIADKHPEQVNQIADEYYSSCRSFLTKFKKIYSLNYDLLLYWTLLHEDPNDPHKIDDGFRNPDYQFGENYRVFHSPHSPRFFFLHGALHIFDAGSEVRKFIWSDTGIPLMTQIRAALDKGMFPLFVAEGNSQEKLKKINHSGYLSKGLRSFESTCKQTNNSAIFIYGHSLDENDAHILSKIDEGNISKIFVSAYKHPKHGYDRSIINRARLLGGSRRKAPQVFVYDAESANVWGQT